MPPVFANIILSLHADTQLLPLYLLLTRHNMHKT